MEFLQLEYFVALAKSEHLSNTAKNLLVTPSAISASIQRLEEEVNCKLFDRTGRNIKLNEYGKIFLGYAESILYNGKQAKEELKTMQNLSPETLTVGLWHPTNFNLAIDDFRKANPKIRFQYILYDPGSIRQEKVPMNLFDLFIAPMGTFDESDWFSRIIFHDEVLLAVPPIHPLADSGTIDLYDFRNEKFVFPLNGSFNQFSKALCLQSGFSPNVYMECEYSARANIIKTENAVSLTTHMAVLGGIMNGVSLLHISNKPYRYQAIHWPKSHKLKPICENFIEHMSKYYSKYPPFL